MTSPVRATTNQSLSLELHLDPIDLDTFKFLGDGTDEFDRILLSVANVICGAEQQGTASDPLDLLFEDFPIDEAASLDRVGQALLVDDSAKAVPPTRQIPTLPLIAASKATFAKAVPTAPPRLSQKDDSESIQFEKNEYSIKLDPTESNDDEISQMTDEDMLHDPTFESEDTFVEEKSCPPSFKQVEIQSMRCMETEVLNNESDLCKEQTIVVSDDNSHSSDDTEDYEEPAERKQVKKVKQTSKKTRKTQVSDDIAVLSPFIDHAERNDVLFGKGGKINKHKGNLDYHAAKRSLQIKYLNDQTSRVQKRELVEELYRIVIEWGGRFLKQFGNGWYEVHPEAALEKCRQALATKERTPSERAARRRMYLDRKKDKIPKESDLEK